MTHHMSYGPWKIHAARFLTAAFLVFREEDMMAITSLQQAISSFQPVRTLRASTRKRHHSHVLTTCRNPLTSAESAAQPGTELLNRKTFSGFWLCLHKNPKAQKLCKNWRRMACRWKRLCEALPALRV